MDGQNVVLALRLKRMDHSVLEFVFDNHCRKETLIHKSVTIGGFMVLRLRAESRTLLETNAVLVCIFEYLPQSLDRMLRWDSVRTDKEISPGRMTAALIFI